MHRIILNNDEECDGHVDVGSVCGDLIECNYCLEDRAVCLTFGEDCLYDLGACLY